MSTSCAEIVNRYIRYVDDSSRCCSEAFFNDTSVIRSVQCLHCHRVVTVQDLILALPPVVSCEAGRDYSKATGDYDIIIRVSLLLIEEKPLIIHMPLKSFQSLFRIFAMVTGQFLILEDLETINPEVHEMMTNVRHPENARAKLFFEEAIQAGIDQQPDETSPKSRLSRSVLTLYKVLLTEFKTSMKVENFDIIEFIVQKLKPMIAALRPETELPLISRLPEDIKTSRLASDWFNFFQELVSRCRMEISPLLSTVDFVLSLLSLVALLQHDSHYDKHQNISAENLYGGLLLSPNPGLANLANLECTVSSEKIQQLVFSLIGFQLFRFSTGFYDNQFLQSSIVRDCIASARRFCSIRRNPTHVAQYRWLPRVLEDPNTDPDRSLLVSIGDLFHAMKTELIKTCRLHNSKDLESSILPLVFPYILFAQKRTAPPTLEAFYAFLPFHVCQKQVLSQTTGNLMRKLSGMRRDIFTLFARTRLLAQGTTIGNPLTSSVLLADEEVSLTLARVLDTLSQIFNESPDFARSSPGASRESINQ
ncbi:hypothetical protein HDE_12489 [Halotydeus destructor]|nr:hypothetical protein HDE_12489 [Halotydeus destructor]